MVAIFYLMVVVFHVIVATFRMARVVGAPFSLKMFPLSRDSLTGNSDSLASDGGV